MVWVKELLRSAPGFPKQYADAVDASKVLMRRHIHAD
jgi:hypothetical protein